MKVCTACKKEKDDVCFTNNTKLCDSCKERRRIKTAIYREKNKEKIALYAKEYYEKNKEKVALYKKEYREKNKVAIKQQARTYYQNNKDHTTKRVAQYRLALPNGYIAHVLKMPVKELEKNPDLLEAKRTQLQIRRLLKTKTSNHGKSNEH